MKDTAMQTDHSDVLNNLTAMEMTIAERKAGLSIMSLEDPNFPKMPLLGAMGWVVAKRSEPSLDYEAYLSRRSAAEVLADLGMDTDEADDQVEAEDQATYMGQVKDIPATP